MKKTKNITESQNINSIDIDTKNISEIIKIFNDDKYADYVSKSAINSSKKYDWKHTSEKLSLLYQELKLR